MAIIQHRKIDQPKSGRRLLECRRTHDAFHDPERRGGHDRRALSDRRKANQ